MGIVRGLGSRVGVEISEDTTGSTYPYTASGTWYRVPLLSDSFHLVRNPYNDLNEIGTIGGRESIEFGRSEIAGEFTVVPRYNTFWFNILLAHAMGSETFVVDTFLDRATSAASGGNTHAYHFNSSTPKGLSIRVYKAGDGASGILETYNGCLITGFTIEQPEGDVLRITFRFTGHSVTLAQAGSDPTALASGQIFNVRDIVNDGSIRKQPEVKTASDYSNSVNLDSFTVECDRKIVPEAAFITSPDDMEKPGITEIRDITLTLNSKLQQIDPTAGAGLKYPYVEYINNTTSAFSAIYESNAADIVTNYSYAFRVNIPAMKWESAEAPVADGGPVVLRATARAQLKTLVAADGHSTVGSPADLRLFTYVDDADDSDGYFTNASAGIAQSGV